MKRRKFTSKFKTKVVLEALSERSTVQELSKKHELHPNQISKWKTEFLSKVESVFDSTSKTTEQEDNTEKLYKVIGQQKVEIDFLKKALQ
ncbi:MAG: transposase [Bacteroidota bacterium]